MHWVIPKRGSVTVRLFAFAIIILALYFFLFYLFLEVWYLKKNVRAEKTSVNLSYVTVHIDLKGTPIKLEYLQSLFPMLKENGVNALLMEYEDMFPYEGRIANLSAKNCYRRSQLRNFLLKSLQSGIEIIPLIQTFGHLEHALKLREFSHLREVSAFPDSICPSKAESRALVKYMVEQVTTFHSTISPLKHIHVGCDEVFHINKCEQCTSKQVSNNIIFLDHIKYISEFIRELNSDLTVLIWDDMLRRIRPYEWKIVDNFDNIEVVHWVYGTSISAPYNTFMNYRKKFKNVWGASAFKGADGITATIPDLKLRMDNHLSWMKLLLNLKLSGDEVIYYFKGIILTGWSRYSHIDPPCELLPASIPSLVVNLRIVEAFRSGVFLDNDGSTDLDTNDKYSKFLSEHSMGLKCGLNPKNGTLDVSSCQFEGIELYNILNRCVDVINKVNANFNDAGPYLTFNTIDYYSQFNFLNMNTLMTNIIKCNKTLNELTNLEAKLVKAMGNYYYGDFIKEYVGSKIYKPKIQVTHILKCLQDNVNSRLWERGPLSNNAHVKVK